MTTENTTVDTKSPRPCNRCKGEGRIHSKFAVDHGYETAEGTECHCCHGTGMFPGLDITALVGILFTTKGGTKRFRKAFPSKYNRFEDVVAGRAYYIWRLARFHGGADVTMPVTADMVVHGDPFKKELDLLADHVAKMVFGTDMAAAYRWGQAMGAIQSAPDGLPASAYPCGPVTDDFKPDWELLELK